MVRPAPDGATGVAPGAVGLRRGPRAGMGIGGGGLQGARREVPAPGRGVDVRSLCRPDRPDRPDREPARAGVGPEPDRRGGTGYRPRRPRDGEGAAARHLRHAAAERLLGRRLDAAGHRARAGSLGGRPGPTSSGRRRWRRGGARRGQHHLDPGPGRAVRAAGPQPGVGAEAESGHRPAPGGVRAGVRPTGRGGVPAHRHRRRRCGPVPGASPVGHPRAHHRECGQPRRDRLRYRDRGGGAQGRRCARGGGAVAGQGDHPANWVACPRRSWYPGSGQGPISPSRPSTSPPSDCTTAATTASPARW